MNRVKRACAAIGIIGISSSAMAQSHPLTTAMTCSEAQYLVASQGAVVLNTSPMAYDRYVASGAYCGVGETAGPAWVRTRDAAQCPVGARCVGVSRGSGP